MPPKANPKVKSGKKEKTGGDVDVANYLKSIEDLTQKALVLERTVKQEQEERNFYQLERDKIHTLYEVAHTQLEQLKQTLQSKDRQVEELVENHQVAVRVYQQKIKDVLYGNSQEATKLKINSEQNLRSEEDFHRSREDELLREIESYKLKIKENQLSAQDMLRSLKENNAREFSIQRNSYEQQIWTMQRDFEVKLRDCLQESEMRRKAEIQEVETNKNNHIADLVRKHQLNFDKMKKYYLDITTSNLDLIKSLKDEVEEMRKKQIANEQLMYDVAQENKRLTQPLQTALAEAEQLKKKLEEANEINSQLKTASENADQRLALIQHLEWENDILKTSLRDTAMERDALKERFEQAVQGVEQNAHFREAVLERRIVALQNEIESLTTKYNETVAAGHLDAAVAQAIGQQTDNVLEGKNRNIRELSFELARVMRLYNEALRVFRGKMVSAGLGTADMDGFRPFEVRDDL
ncbi:Dynein_regulatory complex [Hexamita inflata]|uniref:Dynein regulatory complex n=1 Tax=Hexamita inflata TaxID=28002 RepID=A0AA86NS54_9EUKA|nr:Dynein regulatory complex [Hexamita inflata]CAI9924983.1 Dynein regulatory complex [Hexamita inflata]CAI9945382.1 Dynein regulatory complex [Hexamita inflata]CAI9964002.1 Dynein regulatory complex [Hexamita inflata]